MTETERHSGAWLDALHQLIENQQPISSGECLRLIRMAETEYARANAAEGRVKEQEQEIIALRAYLWRIRDAVMREGGWCYDYRTMDAARIAQKVNMIWREARDAGHKPFLPDEESSEKRGGSDDGEV